MFGLGSRSWLASRLPRRGKARKGRSLKRARNTSPEHAESQVGNLELDQLFLEREKLNTGIASALDEATQPWGIRVFRYEI